MIDITKFVAAVHAVFPHARVKLDCPHPYQYHSMTLDCELRVEVGDHYVRFTSESVGRGDTVQLAHDAVHTLAHRIVDVSMRGGC